MAPAAQQDDEFLCRSQPRRLHPTGSPSKRSEQSAVAKGDGDGDGHGDGDWSGSRAAYGMLCDVISRPSSSSGSSGSGWGRGRVPGELDQPLPAMARVLISVMVR